MVLLWSRLQTIRGSADSVTVDESGVLVSGLTGKKQVLISGKSSEFAMVCNSGALTGTGKQVHKQKPAMVSKGVYTVQEVGDGEGLIRLQQGKYVEDRGMGSQDIGIGSEVPVQQGQEAKKEGLEEVVAGSGQAYSLEVSATDASGSGGKKESKELKKKKLPYMGITKPLGAHLMLATKENIWKGEYVEVFKLLHRDVRAKEGSKEEEYELSRHPRVPVTVENWSSAFLIYA